MDFSESARRAVEIMTSGKSPAEKDELFRQLSREDGRPTVVRPGWARVGDRACVTGYQGNDGWSTVIAKDDAARRLLVRFDDGEEHVWEWGSRGGGAHLSLIPGDAASA